MSDTESTGKEKSLGTLFRDLAEDLSTLVRSEIALAKLEIRQAAISLGIGGAFMAGAVFCVLFACAFLMVTAVLLLALVMPAWVAALIIAILLIVVAGVLALVGKKKLEGARFVPSDTIESVKTDVRSIRSELSRANRG